MTEAALERWTIEERVEAIDVLLESDEGRRFLEVFAGECEAEDREAFLRDAARRLRTEHEEAARWWDSLRVLVEEDPPRDLALAEPLAQIGVDLDEIYEALPDRFDRAALLDAASHLRRAQSGDLAPGLSNTEGWSEEQIRLRFDEVRPQLGIDEAAPQAREWWDSFALENQARPSLLLRLAEELAVRRAGISDFFEAFALSQTDNVQANLHYLEYLRWKKLSADAPAGLRTDGSGWWLKSAPNITRLRGWTDEQIRIRLAELREQLQLEQAEEGVRVWWETFERENHARPALILRVVEELMRRRAGLAAFFEACEQAGVGEIRACLEYFDYARLKRNQEEERKREQEKRERAAARARTRAERIVQAQSRWGILPQNAWPELSEEDRSILLYFPRAEVPPEARELFDRALGSFAFDTVTLDETGAITERRRMQAARVCEEIAPGAVIELVELPGGAFLMGSPNEGEYDDEKPRHEVIVSPFHIGKFPVTQEQWEIVAGWEKIERELDADPSRFKGDDRPVENVSWDDAMEFCARLSSRTGHQYRLPTEAEWEYACHAGTTTPFAFGETITPEIVNYDGNRPYAKAKQGEYREQTVPVGSLGAANAFGLYDMHGNVWEWCSDWYDGDYYKECHEQGAVSDPPGPVAGSDRVIRGGSWYSVAVFCRSACRSDADPGYRYDGVGFRLVRIGR